MTWWAQTLSSHIIHRYLSLIGSTETTKTAGDCLGTVAKVLNHWRSLPEDQGNFNWRQGDSHVGIRKILPGALDVSGPMLIWGQMHRIVAQKVDQQRDGFDFRELAAKASPVADPKSDRVVSIA